MKRLSIEDQQSKLSELDVEWSLPGDESLHRVYKFDNYKQAVKFVNKVAKIAEKINHHPDIALSWAKVEVILRSHQVNGLTVTDFDLAKKIDRL